MRDCLGEHSELELHDGQGADFDDDDLLVSGLFDSLGVVRLIGFIQAEFGLVVPAEDVILENFQTQSATVAFAAQ